MQVHALVTSHVVAFSRIGEEVWLGAGLGTGIEELQRMLRHTSGVVHADDNLQFALEVAFADAEWMAKVEDRIIRPTVSDHGMENFM